jgi:AraC-like DNA-binding protein
VDGPWERYEFIPDVGTGAVLASADKSSYYYASVDYSSRYGYRFRQCINERYAVVTLVDAGGYGGSGATRRVSGELPVGVSFQLNTDSRFSEWISCPAGMRIRGASITLRERYLQALVIPTLRNVAGSETGAFALLLRAGHRSLPVFARALASLETCGYSGSALAVKVDSAVLEICAALLHEGTKPLAGTIAELSIVERRAVANAESVLQDRMDRPPSVRELSRMVGLNFNKLQRGFKALHGVTVMSYLRRARMERALDLLTGDRSIAEIASAVGFKSPSRFAECFTRAYGISPSVYQRNVVPSALGPCI